jgi:hypothetical protein
MSATHPDKLALRIVSWGPVYNVCKIKVTVDILAPLSAQLDGPSLNFMIDDEGAEAITDIVVYSGNSPLIQSIVSNPEFKSAVNREIMKNLASLSTLFPPIDLSPFIGLTVGQGGETETSVKTKVLDGGLALGVDIVSGSITTSGDITQLGDVTEGFDMAVWNNSAVIDERMYGQVHDQLAGSVAEQGGTLDAFYLKSAESAIKIGGSAHSDEGSVNFSMDMTPLLVTGGTYYGRSGALSFSARNIVVDIDLEWWARLLEVVIGLLTFGIAALVVESFIEMIRNNITSQIRGKSYVNVSRARFEYTLPNDPTKTTISARVKRFDCHSDGLFTALDFIVEFPSPRIVGPSGVDIECFRPPGRGRVMFEVKHPLMCILSDDPEVRTAWTVREAENNKIVLVNDSPGLSPLNIVAVSETEMADQSSHLLISCRIYRTLDTISELFGGYTDIRVMDWVDRSHPYVHWTHDARAQEARVERDGSVTVLGNHVKHRRSKIHRTDLPLRCHNVRWGVIPIDKNKLKVEYLDELPFPPEEIARSREQLCDYCFFGGPDRNVTLPLPEVKRPP